MLENIIEDSNSGREIADRARGVAHDIREGQEASEAQLRDLFSQQDITGPEAVEVFDLRPAADTLEEKGAQIGDIVGNRATEEIDGNVAGYAEQGKEGSTVIDVTAAMQPDAQGHHTIDVQMLQDVVDHEGEHEKQAQKWNAEVVDVGNGQSLDRIQISEVGAMSVQSSLAWVSADYKQMYAYVTSLGISAEEARTAARDGDLLGLAEEIREEREVTTPVGQEA